MSYALPGQEPPAQPAGRRPGTVTAATWLLILAGVLLALPFFFTLPVLGAFQDAFREVFKGTEQEGAEGFVAGLQLGRTAFWLLLGAGFVVLAIFNYRGANPSRIVTWVLGGLALCCAGVGLVGSLAAGMDMQGELNAEEIQRAVEEHVPSWYLWVDTLAIPIAIVPLIVVLILLALPPSNRFFRKQPPAGPPVNPPAGYPQPGA